MNNKKYILFLLCLPLIWSCENLVNDLDERKLPQTGSKLVVECYISPQSDKISVKVTESQPLFGAYSVDPIFIRDAVVILSGPNGGIKLPYKDSTLNYTVDSGRFEINAGMTYTLTVNDGKRNVKALCTVPANRVVVKSYTMDTIRNYRYEGNDAVRVKVAWEDFKGEENYYTIRGDATTEITGFSFDPSGAPMTFRRNDRETFDFSNENYFVTDVNLDGQVFTSPSIYLYLYKAYVIKYTDKNGVSHNVDSNPICKEINVEILSLDLNYYKFFRSLKDSGNNGNPFVEPALVYSNIEGGLGCFGAYNTGVLKIRP